MSILFNPQIRFQCASQLFDPQGRPLAEPMAQALDDMANALRRLPFLLDRAADEKDPNRDGIDILPYVPGGDPFPPEPPGGGGGGVHTMIDVIQSPSGTPQPAPHLPQHGRCVFLGTEYVTAEAWAGQVQLAINRDEIKDTLTFSGKYPKGTDSVAANGTVGLCTFLRALGGYPIVQKTDGHLDVRIPGGAPSDMYFTFYGSWALTRISCLIVDGTDLNAGEHIEVRAYTRELDGSWTDLGELFKHGEGGGADGSLTGAYTWTGNLAGKELATSTGVGEPLRLEWSGAGAPDGNGDYWQVCLGFAIQPFVATADVTFADIVGP